MNSTQNKSWRCRVCGYIHTGSHPPDSCPICGVGASEFEEAAPAKKISQISTVEKWRCTVCGYIHSEDKAPSICPVCAASANMFSAVTSEKHDPSSSKQGQKVVLIGAGVAGVSAAEAVREVSPAAEIVLISNETGLPYYRLNLTRFIAGDIRKDELIINSEEWYKERKISIIHGHAISIDPENKRIMLSEENDTGYDKLIITMGAHPFMPPFPGLELSGIMNLRTLADAEEILHLSKTTGRCLCVGGGVLGIETAASLARSRLKVTLLESHDWLMPRQLNKRAGIMLQKNLEKTGVEVRTNTRVEHFEGNGSLAGVLLSDRTTLSAQLAVITTGIRGNTYIAKQSGLQVGSGIQVDSCLRTSAPDIYAAGDVAEHNGTVYGLWGAARFQGKFAGRNAMGIHSPFGGIPRSNTLKILDLDLVSIGQIQPEDGSCRVIDGFTDNNEYYYFLFHDNILVGAILFGNTGLSAMVKTVIEERVDCSGTLFPNAGIKDVTGFLS